VRTLLPLFLVFLSVATHAQNNRWRLGADAGVGFTSGRHRALDCEGPTLRGATTIGAQMTRMFKPRWGLTARGEWMSLNHFECFTPEGVPAGTERTVDPQQSARYLNASLALRFTTPTPWVRAFVEAGVGPSLLLNARGEFYRYENSRAMFYEGDLYRVFQPVNARYSIASGIEAFGLSLSARYSALFANAFRDSQRPYDWTGTRFGALTFHLGVSIGFGDRNSGEAEEEEYLQASYPPTQL
jgi:hypothetical protein